MAGAARPHRPGLAPGLIKKRLVHMPIYLFLNLMGRTMRYPPIYIYIYKLDALLTSTDNTSSA